MVYFLPQKLICNDCGAHLIIHLENMTNRTHLWAELVQDEKPNISLDPIPNTIEDKFDHHLVLFKTTTGYGVILNSEMGSYNQKTLRHLKKPELTISHLMNKRLPTQ